VKQRIVINADSYETRVAILEHDELAELFVERSEQRRSVGEARCRRAGASVRAGCALALGLLAVGMAAVSASAQTLTVSNQVFPLTQVGHSTSQAVTFTYSDDLWLNSVLIDPAYSEYALTGVSCGIGNYLPAVTPCTLTISFAPKLPEAYRATPYLFLANIHPALQLNVLEQMESPVLTAADTMNFWISSEKDLLTKVIQRVNVMFVNDAEIRQYTGIDNVIEAARALLDAGPKAVIVKKGGHGAVMFSKTESGSGPLGMSFFSAPAYPIARLTDPTGAGDSFAGGFIGHLAKGGDVSEAAMRRAIIYGTTMASFNVGISA